MGPSGSANGPGTLAKPLGGSDQPSKYTGLSAVDQCVHCGLCLPHCPTYELHRQEGDSPRGRLTLMQGLARGELDPQSPRLRSHLEGCLGCRSCEAVCPAGVPFGALMDRTREILLQESDAPESAPLPMPRMLHDRLLGSPRLRRLAGLGARAAARLPRAGLPGLDATVRRALEHARPSLAPPPRLRADGPPDAVDVLLFTGCMDAFFTGPDLEAALSVLHALDLRVGIPSSRTCCGALDRHAGRPAAATELERHNREAFGAAEDGPPVIVLDSGCEATLREAADSFPGARATSLTRFVARHLEEHGPPRDGWREDPVRVALHRPCTQRNVTREGEILPTLLRGLPGVTLAGTPSLPNCCGAGGTAMLAWPEQADALGQQTLQALGTEDPDCIVSGNVGCRVHLRALQPQSPEDPPLVSPARFLAGRLAVT